MRRTVSMTPTPPSYRWRPDRKGDFPPRPLRMDLAPTAGSRGERYRYARRGEATAPLRCRNHPGDVRTVCVVAAWPEFRVRGQTRNRPDDVHLSRDASDFRREKINSWQSCSPPVGGVFSEGVRTRAAVVSTRSSRICRAFLTRLSSTSGRVCDVAEAFMIEFSIRLVAVKLQPILTANCPRCQYKWKGPEQRRTVEAGSHASG